MEQSKHLLTSTLETKARACIFTKQTWTFDNQRKTQMHQPSEHTQRCVHFEHISIMYAQMMLHQTATHDCGKIKVNIATLFQMLAVRVLSS